MVVIFTFICVTLSPSFFAAQEWNLSKKSTRYITRERTKKKLLWKRGFGAWYYYLDLQTHSPPGTKSQPKRRRRRKLRWGTKHCGLELVTPSSFHFSSRLVSRLHINLLLGPPHGSIDWNGIILIMMIDKRMGSVVESEIREMRRDSLEGRNGLFARTYRIQIKPTNKQTNKTNKKLTRPNLLRESLVNWFTLHRIPFSFFWRLHQVIIIIILIIISLPPSSILTIIAGWIIHSPIKIRTHTRAVIHKVSIYATNGTGNRDIQTFTSSNEDTHLHFWWQIL